MCIKCWEISGVCEPMATCTANRLQEPLGVSYGEYTELKQENEKLKKELNTAIEWIKDHSLAPFDKKRLLHYHELSHALIKENEKLKAENETLTRKINKAI